MGHVKTIGEVTNIAQHDGMIHVFLAGPVASGLAVGGHNLNTHVELVL